MHSLFAVTIGLYATVATTAPIVPDQVPSIHPPLTGLTPPKVPVASHGQPRPWTPPSNAGQATGAAGKGPGKYWSGWNGVRKLFVFGDSYTTTGFDPTQAQPSPNIPLGNPAYPGYTSSNGPNYIDYLTVKYNQSLVETYNLAYGGATVDSDLVAQYESTVLDFRQQVNQEFVPYYVDQNNAGWTSANSLFISFFGINDVGNSYYENNATLNGDILNVYAGLVDELYQDGARNFLFLNVPPTDKAPLITAYGASAEASIAADITDFNNRVASLAANLSSYADTTVFLFDTNALFDQVLSNPASYPSTSIYKNTTAFCAAYQNGTPAQDTLDPSCGIPVNQYFWLNSLHPTYPLHDALASQVAKKLEGSPL